MVNQFKYKVVLNSLDPSKYGKALADKLFVELGQSSDKTVLIIESEQNSILLKRKLGIVSDSDIILIKDSSQDTETKDKVTQISQKVSDVIILDNTKVEPTESEVEQDKSGENPAESEEKSADFGTSSVESSKSSEALIMPQMHGIKLEVPVIKDTSYQGIENYIADMKRAKEYGNFEKDKDLIFSSLVKSDRTGLYNDMAKGDEAEIEKFGEFLKNIYGLNEENLLKRFRELKQKEGENPLQFFNRLVRLFYRIRGIEIPDKIEDKVHKLEMTQSFLQGLRNAEVVKILSRIRKTTEFKDLGKVALDYEKLETTNYHEMINKLDHLAIENSDNSVEGSSQEDRRVNFVNADRGKANGYSRDSRFNRNYSRNRFYNNKDYDRRSSRDQSRDRKFSRGRDYSRGRENSRGRNFSRDRNFSQNRSDRDQRSYQNKGYDRSLSRGRNDYRDRSQSRDRGYQNYRDQSRDRNQGQGRRREFINDGRCFRCGYKGHIRAECRANDKTVAAYKRRQEGQRERY